MENSFKINLRERKTEAGWQESIDQFFLVASPKFFEWLGWSVLLGGLSFIQKKYESKILAEVVVLSYLMMWGYFNAIFYRLKIIGIFRLDQKKIGQIMSILTSGLITLCTFYCITRVVIEVSKAN